MLFKWHKRVNKMLMKKELLGKAFIKIALDEAFDII